jgi:hypothetical protein
MARDRNSSPDAAFAFVGKIGDKTFKLLRHHNLDTVRDGTEHDTVDKTLLVAGLRMIKQVPVGDEKKEQIRAHLMEHAIAFRLDINEESARKLINQQLGGPSGNDSLNAPDVNGKKSLPEDPQMGPADLPKPGTNPGPGPEEMSKKKVVQTDEEKEVNNPAANDDARASAAEGDEESTEEEEESEAKVYNGDKKKKKGNQTKAQQKLTTTRADGHTHTVSEGASKTSVNNGHSHSVTRRNGRIVIGRADGHTHSVSANASVGDFVSIKDSDEIGIIIKIDDTSASIRLSNDDEKVIDISHIVVLVRDTIGDNPKSLKIVNSRDTVDAIATVMPVSQPRKVMPKKTGLPKNENEDTTSNKPTRIVLDRDEKLIENPNKDKFGRQSLISDVSSITKEGKDFIIQRLNEALDNKVVARIENIDKLGSIEFMSVTLGEDKDFPITLMVEVARDSEDKVAAIRILNESIPGDALADFAKFLRGLLKSTSSDLAKAGAKFERCVRDVTKRRVEQFRKRRGRAPNTKERKELESSAFAICTESVGRDK